MTQLKEDFLRKVILALALALHQGTQLPAPLLPSALPLSFLTRLLLLRFVLMPDHEMQGLLRMFMGTSE